MAGLFTPRITRRQPGRYHILDGFPCPHCGPRRMLLSLCPVCGAEDIEFIKNCPEIEPRTNALVETWKFYCPHCACSGSEFMCGSCENTVPVAFFILEPGIPWLFWLGVVLAIAVGLYLR